MTTMNLEQRKALLWFKRNQPTRYPRHALVDCPSRKMYEWLVGERLIQIGRVKQGVDIFTFTLTDAGRKALEGQPPIYKNDVSEKENLK